MVENAAGSYTVTVRAGGATTTHSVAVPADLAEALGCAQVPEAELVRCSFAFLLEREAPTSILRTFSLEQIGDYFPEYRDTIRRSLSEESGRRPPGS